MYEFEIILKNGKSLISWGYTNKDAATRAGIEWKEVQASVNLGYWD